MDYQRKFLRMNSLQNGKDHANLHFPISIYESFWAILFSFQKLIFSYLDNFIYLIFLKSNEQYKYNNHKGNTNTHKGVKTTTREGKKQHICRHRHYCSRCRRSRDRSNTTKIVAPQKHTTTNKNPRYSKREKTRG